MATAQPSVRWIRRCRTAPEVPPSADAQEAARKDATEVGGFMRWLKARVTMLELLLLLALLALLRK